MPSTDKYHPFRYARQRIFAKQVQSYWQSSIGTSMIPTHEAIGGIKKIIMNGYDAALDELPVMQRPANADLLFDEVNRGVTYGSFCANGRNIFEFSSDLVGMFRKTDVGEVPASSIVLPYPIFYIHFGIQKDLLLSEGRWVDGAYVFLQKFEENAYLHVDLSTITDESPYPSSDSFIVNADKRYHLSFDIAQDRSLSKIIEESLTKEKAVLKPPINHGHDFKEIQKEAVELGIEVSSKRAVGGARRTEALLDGFSVYRESINLVINALFYLSAYPDATEIEWPTDAPSSLTKKADAGQTFKEKRRAESKLLPLGFTRINFCRLSEKYSHQDAHLVDSGVNQHWRRGHWRNQPYGEGRMLRRLKWIMPVLVNADTCNEDAITGHLYTVKD